MKNEAPRTLLTRRDAPFGMIPVALSIVGRNGWVRYLVYDEVIEEVEVVAERHRMEYETNSPIFGPYRVVTCYAYGTPRSDPTEWGRVTGEVPVETALDVHEAAIRALAPQRTTRAELQPESTAAQPVRFSAVEGM